jgi:hypothetical protein
VQIPDLPYINKAAAASISPAREAPFFIAPLVVIGVLGGVDVGPTGTFGVDLGPAGTAGLLVAAVPFPVG